MLLSFSELDVLIYQGKVGGLFRERKNERVATDIDSRNKSSSSSHEYDSVLSFQFICDNGKEINVNLTNWNINIFPGQELIIYFVENSKKNKSTSEVTNNVQEMYKEFFYTSYFKLIIPFLLIISYFMSSISVAIMSFVLYVIIRRRIGKDFFSEIKRKRLKKEDIMGLEHVI
ncbi:hypothetical protein RCV21_03990 [Escherichia coli]|nr:hypothetical protein [Escherichia coli]MED8878023.1 hypothetical protein [Escherichia coli]